MRSKVSTVEKLCCIRSHSVSCLSLSLCVCRSVPGSVHIPFSPISVFIPKIAIPRSVKTFPLRHRCLARSHKSRVSAARFAASVSRFSPFSRLRLDLPRLRRRWSTRTSRRGAQSPRSASKATGSSRALSSHPHRQKRNPTEKKTILRKKGITTHSFGCRLLGRRRRLRR